MSTGASRSLSLIGLGLVTTFGLACQTTPERFEFTEVHMGVPVRVVLYAASSAEAAEAARAGFGRVRALDGVMSDYRPDSELTRLGATYGEWVPVSRELFSVLGRALEVAEATDGAFDPTIGPLTTLWRRSRESGRLPNPDEIETARGRTGWRHLELDPGQEAVRLGISEMTLNLGGIAKGFILDEALAAVREAGAARALVEAGGDIVVGDPPPGQLGWRVDVGDPPAGQLGWRVDVGESDEDFAGRAAALANAALATSGASAQFVDIDGVRYSHVIDPSTGLGLTHDLVVHVVAPDGATADALATAIGVLGHMPTAVLRDRFPGAVVAIRSGPRRDQ